MNSKLPCRCCLLRPPDKDMSTVYMRLGRPEIYSEMLKECFEIHLNLGSEMGGSGICEICVGRLRDACEFKHQVQYCQKTLEGQQENMSIVKGETPTVKEEFMDVEVLEEDMAFTGKVKEVDYEDEDAQKLTERLGLESVSVKRRTKRCGEQRGERRVQWKRKPAPGRKKLIIIPTKSHPDVPNVKVKLSLQRTENEKRLENMNNILKYSNCTPFVKKTLTGFVCEYCKETYTGIGELRHHTATEHKNESLQGSVRDKKNWCLKMDIADLKCNICEAKVDLIKDLKDHLTKKHGVKFYPNVFDNILEFKLTDSSEVFDCALCNSSYETFKMLLQHTNKHYRNYVCEVCDEGFINMTRLKNHEQTHATGDFPCSFCDKVFVNRLRKTLHEKHTHNPNARYTTTCPHCDETFHSYFRRNRHMAEEHNAIAAYYRCNSCDRSFIVKSSLTKHIKKVHLMERNHICPECGLSFHEKKSLEEHMSKHTGERMFECSVCHKAYARKKTLREHMRIHENDRRFKCGVCGLKFVQKCSMKSHMLSNHGMTLTEYENGADAYQGLGKTEDESS